MGEMFMGRTPYSGLSAAFMWNHIFAQVKSPDGTPVRFFAGPGFAVGASKELDGPRGIFFGLKGRAGAQFVFERGINVSVSASPILGLHMSKEDENFVTDIYKSGILQMIVPEIGISLRF
jgi:hypothetical protein